MSMLMPKVFAHWFCACVGCAVGLKGKGKGDQGLFFIEFLSLNPARFCLAHPARLRIATPPPPAIPKLNR